MRVVVCADAEALGQAAASDAARLLRAAVAERGSARLLLSTGRSQFTTLAALVRLQLPWPAVEAFHLDEYIGVAPDHPASFRRYLHERFASQVNLRRMHYVDTEGDPAEAIRCLTEEVRRAPIDVALVGVGENGHIAFNDPPADFTTAEAYTVVTLAPECRAQQRGEGWFATVDQVPERAVTMTATQIMASRAIVSAVPYAVKATAIRRVLTEEVTPWVPATILKRHPSATMFLDPDSSAAAPPEVLRSFSGGTA